MKNRLWTYMNQKAWSTKRKQMSFLGCYMLFCAICGAAAYFLVGQWILPTIVWMICFIGYPCFFVGFLDGVIFLFNR